MFLFRLVDRACFAAVKVEALPALRHGLQVGAVVGVLMQQLLHYALAGGKVVRRNVLEYLLFDAQRQGLAGTPYLESVQAVGEFTRPQVRRWRFLRLGWLAGASCLGWLLRGLFWLSRFLDVWQFRPRDDALACTFHSAVFWWGGRTGIA